MASAESSTACCVESPDDSDAVTRGTLAGFDRVAVFLSTGRTGTTALAQYFDAAYPDVVARHEPRPSRHLRVMSNRRLAQRSSRTAAASALYAARRRFFSESRGSLYIESNPYLYGFLDVFDDVFRSARVVHIVRDPRSYVRSAINFGFSTGMRALATALVPYWSLKPELCEDPVRRSWGEMDPVERLAWFWNRINRHLAQGEALFGERYMRIRFEDLFDTRGAALHALARWLGLPHRTQLVDAMRAHAINASKSTRLPNWDSWPEPQKDALRRQCSHTAAEYGYTLQ